MQEDRMWLVNACIATYKLKFRAARNGTDSIIMEYVKLSDILIAEMTKNEWGKYLSIRNDVTKELMVEYEMQRSVLLKQLQH